MVHDHQQSGLGLRGASSRFRELQLLLVMVFLDSPLEISPSERNPKPSSLIEETAAERASYGDPRLASTHALRDSPKIHPAEQLLSAVHLGLSRRFRMA